MREIPIGLLIKAETLDEYLRFRNRMLQIALQTNDIFLLGTIDMINAWKVERHGWKLREIDDVIHDLKLMLKTA